jgi:hypothetical protein
MGAVADRVCCGQPVDRRGCGRIAAARAFADHLEAENALDLSVFRIFFAESGSHFVGKCFMSGVTTFAVRVA